MFLKGFTGVSVVKNLPANARDLGSIPGPRRPPGEGKSCKRVGRDLVTKEQQQQQVVVVV